MLKKYEVINPSLEKLINKVQQANELHLKIRNSEKWLLNQKLGTDILNQLFSEAASQGQLEFMTLLAAHVNLDPTKSLIEATKEGHLNVVKI